jgi:hypothetical protein
MGFLIIAMFAGSTLSLLAARPADAQQPNPASEIRRHVAGSSGLCPELIIHQCSW